MTHTFILYGWKKEKNKEYTSRFACFIWYIISSCVFQPHLVSTQTYVNFSGQRNLRLCFLL